MFLERAVLVKCFEKTNQVDIAGVVWLRVLHGLQQPMVSVVVRDGNGVEDAYWLSYNFVTENYQMHQSGKLL